MSTRLRSSRNSAAPDTVNPFLQLTQLRRSVEHARCCYIAQPERMRVLATH